MTKFTLLSALVASGLLVATLIAPGAQAHDPTEDSFGNGADSVFEAGSGTMLEAPDGASTNELSDDMSDSDTGDMNEPGDDVSGSDTGDTMEPGDDVSGSETGDTMEPGDDVSGTDTDDVNEPGDVLSDLIPESGFFSDLTIEDLLQILSLIFGGFVSPVAPTIE